MPKKPTKNRKVQNKQKQRQKQKVNVVVKIDNSKKSTRTGGGQTQPKPPPQPTIIHSGGGYSAPQFIPYPMQFQQQQPITIPQNPLTQPTQPNAINHTLSSSTQTEHKPSSTVSTQSNNFDDILNKIDTMGDKFVTHSNAIQESLRKLQTSNNSSSEPSTPFMTPTNKIIDITPTPTPPTNKPTQSFDDFESMFERPVRKVSTNRTIDYSGNFNKPRDPEYKLNSASFFIPSNIYETTILKQQQPEKTTLDTVLQIEDAPKPLLQIENTPPSPGRRPDAAIQAKKNKYESNKIIAQEKHQQKEAAKQIEQQIEEYKPKLEQNINERKQAYLTNELAVKNAKILNHMGFRASPYDKIMKEINDGTFDINNIPTQINNYINALYRYTTGNSFSGKKTHQKITQLLQNDDTKLLINKLRHIEVNNISTFPKTMEKLEKQRQTKEVSNIHTIHELQGRTK